MVCGFFAYKKILGQIETQTRDKKYFGLQRFFNEYFVDIDSVDVEFEGFTPDIRAQPVYLINSCRDRQIASDSRQPHIVIDIGLPTGLAMVPSIIGIAVRHSRQELRTNLCHDMAELVDVDPESKTWCQTCASSQRLLLHEYITCNYYDKVGRGDFYGFK